MLKQLIINNQQLSSSQSHYHTFCKKLGYVTPMESVLRPHTGETVSNPSFSTHTFILSLSKHIESRNIHFNLVFEPYDKEKTGEISQADFINAMEKIEFFVPNIKNILEEYESPNNKTRIDYKKIIYAVELERKALNTIYQAFSIMEKEMNLANQTDLYKLLEKWDQNIVKRFNKSDFRNILESLCHIQGISESDLDVIVHHFNPRGAGVVDFFVLEKEYKEFVAYRPQTMDTKRKMLQYFNDYCDCFNVELGKALHKYNMKEGVLKKEDFEIACKEICKGKVTDMEIENFYNQLRNPLGDIYVPFLLAQYNSFFKVESQKKELLLTKMAHQLIELKFDLLSNLERLDVSKKSTLPLKDVLNMLITDLELGEESYSSLAVLLLEYDISKNGLQFMLLSNQKSHY